MRFLKHYHDSYLSYFLMYFFFFFSLEFFSGFISVYLMDQGYSASQVSFVVSCSYILSVIVHLPLENSMINMNQDMLIVSYCLLQEYLGSFLYS